MNLKDLEGKEIVIYGAGHVGQKFYRTLRMYGMEKQVIRNRSGRRRGLGRGCTGKMHP